MKPFPLPVVAFVGAGSQPEDPDLAYMPLPVQMDSFTMPALPSSEDISHLNTALAVIGELAELAARWTPAQGSLSRSLAGLRGWGEYQQDIQAVLARPVSRPPAIGIKVASPTSPGACA